MRERDPKWWAAKLRDLRAAGRTEEELAPVVAALEASREAPRDTSEGLSRQTRRARSSSAKPKRSR